MPEINHPATVELNPSWHAAAEQCGSCRLFKRRASSLEDPDTFGLCNFVLPKFMAWKVDIPPPKGHEAGWEVDPRTVQDTDSCDLYRRSESQYVQKKYWSV